METEAKFEVPDRATARRLAALESVGDCRLGSARETRVVDDYYDTKERRLLSAGYALRIRRAAGGGIMLTLKQVRSPRGGVYRRQESECALRQRPRGRLFRADDIPDPALRARAAALSRGAPLCLLVRLEQTRRIRPVRRGRNLIAEWSLDRVTMYTPRRETTYELEIELVGKGTGDDLRRIARVLRRDWHLNAQHESKFERAIRATRLLAP